MKKLFPNTLFFPAFFFLFTSFLQAQYYSTGQDPASMRWKQIKTDDFRIIYPGGFEHRAQYLANILDIIKEPEKKTLRSETGRIPIIIHSQSSVSNGYTVWAPKRIELYPMPPADTYPEEWLEQLIIHEYRHAVQISKMNQGFTKVLYYILGEQATGGILGLFIPSWFLEGDATCMETALSNSGRGRIPSFAAPLRAQVLEKGIYSYDKATLGSYKSYIPNSYILGYHLVGKTRENFGPGFWNLPLDRTAKYPFMIVPFASGIKKQASLSKTTLYKSILNQFDSIWKVQEDRTGISEFRLISRQEGKKRSSYTLYERPLFLNDSLIVAKKKSLDETSRFLVTGFNRKEKKLFLLGNYQEASLSAAVGKITWAEYQPDERWSNRSFSIIKTYDFETKKVRKLTSRSTYFSPVISPDGTRICAVQIDDRQNSRIDILDALNGSIIYTLKGPVEGLILQPRWDPSSEKLVYILLDHRGKSIIVHDLETNKNSVILEASFREISNPSFHRRYIVFNADYSGIENIYALDTITGGILQVTSARFGSRDPDFNESTGEMIYSCYNSDGFMIASTVADPEKWIPMGSVRDHSYPLYNTLAKQENVNIQDSNITKKLYKLNYHDPAPDPSDSIISRIFPSVKYSKGAHLFNIHSWAPLSVNINNLSLAPGVSVMSQNLLSSTFITSGYDYNINEGTGKVYLDLSYQGLYPVFDLAFSYGRRASYYHKQADDEPVRFTWEETNLDFTISIPWNLSYGKFYRSLKPGIGTTLIHSGHNASTPDVFTKGWIQSMDYSLFFSQYVHSTAKDMYPRWGQALRINFRNTPYTGNDMGSIEALQAWLYFPGLFNHHSIWFYGGIQRRAGTDLKSYRYSDIIRYPWGYENNYDDKIFSLGFNYKLPLFYPDFSIGSLLYFTRFKMNLFFDYAEGRNPGKLSIYKSTGAELTADFHFLRFVAPLELGVRSIYFPDTGTWGWQVVYSVSY